MTMQIINALDSTYTKTNRVYSSTYAMMGKISYLLSFRNVCFILNADRFF